MNELTTTATQSLKECVSAADYLDMFLASVDIKTKSKDTYRKALKHYFEYLQQNGIAGADREDILKYKSDLMANYSACTVSAYMTAVRAFYSYLEAMKIYPNIAAGIKGAKSGKGFKKDCLTVTQAQKALTDIDTDSIEGLRDFAIINLLIHTGLRTIEVQRANIGDIRQQGGKTLLYIQGKGRDTKDDFVILTDSTLTPIMNYLSARGKTKLDMPLFACHSNRNAGGRLTTRSISRIAKNSMINAGINSDRLTAHSLRHTAVTFSLMAGASIQEAQQLARHSNINTTMIYAHNLQRVSDTAPEFKIDNLLKGL